MQPASAIPQPPTVAAFTAPGAPFELIDAQVGAISCRLFRHAPRSLPELYAAARQHAAREFTVMDAERLSYGQVFAQAASLAAHLAEEGVGRGTHVALAMRNRPAWLIAFIAVSALGAVPVLCNSRGAGPELAHGVRHTRSRWVIADERCAQLLQEAEPAAAFRGIVDGAAPGGARPWSRWSELTAGSAPRPLPLTACAPEDPALIMFTSGTTGEAKAAVLSHVGVLTALMANQLSGALLQARLAAHLKVPAETLARQAPPPCTLLVFPLFHTSGCLSVFLTSLARGGRIVFLPRWEVGAALRLIEGERVSALPAVPTMLWDLLQSPQLEHHDTSSLVSLASGGQALPQGLLQAIRARFPRVLLGTGYGMTETNGMVSLALGEDYLAHPESAGQPLATAQLRIVDEADAEVPRGVRGEICVRSAQNMLGYFERPEADAEVLRGGWLHTGDVGFLDPEGYLHIVARKTDMVISGGENVYCAEVERVLLEHPQVLEAAAIGVADERLGERLLAVLVPRAGAALEEGQLQGFCAARLARYKVPALWRIESGPLERSASGKVLKAQLRARLSGA